MLVPSGSTPGSINPVTLGVSAQLYELQRLGHTWLCPVGSEPDGIIEAVRLRGPYPMMGAGPGTKVLDPFSPIRPKDFLQHGEFCVYSNTL
ncbi:hypothetical protein AAFF_G00439250 [Aldrovandia affinis]|uniref:Uncharacterized protein n=1 Tax=Aldrovandia affinis TaxID=143900 RepID=A0AAD7WHL7_9TELE|nr:hypothetical protein AAFF_G00439250 [Aldrovandia affinis]